MTSNRYVILLTYKGKILLLSKENKLDILPYNPWGFIEKQTEKTISGKDTLIREVLKEAKIKLSDLTPISSSSIEDGHEYVFHAHLSDLEVNSIERSDDSLMQFYSLSELQKLNLQESTKFIFTKYKSELEALMN